YTGPASGSFQEILPQFLVALRSAVGREIVLVGGSAGGFASLFYSSVVGCAAFVWNPQTDLLRYGAWAVREYLVAVLDDPRWGAREGLDRHAVEPIDLATARRELSQAGIESMVGPADRIAKLVYLQNSSDHHLERHAEPYRFRNGFRDLGDGLYGQNSTLMAVGPFSEGHRAPRREIIENALHLAIEPDVDLESGLRRLREL
ncbi:hypothetical protein ACT3SQ_19255, partial [Brachybacterium sp. AOP42-C2-15]|uniref:hypothetical protein n=1 Tax=Brachybacterium sp. AOP42-C2-15 TaxID=3457670 RepID=UPI004034B93D